MEARSHNWIHRSGFGHVVLLAVCFSSLLILLTFPIERAHRFGVHFRAGEVRRTIDRDTPLAFGDARSPDPRSRHEIVAALAAPVLSAAVIHAEAPSEATEIPLTRLLSRLKLCSHSSDPDSLS